MGIKRIVIITTGQPSTNPRALKEAIALAGAGYEVTFVYCFWAVWALATDKRIIKENLEIKWLNTGGSPVKNKPAYYISRLTHKYFRLLARIFPAIISFERQAASRGFSSLAKISSGIKADLYIAHNLGALPVAALAAKKNKAKYAFDAEDYHRGQEIAGSIEQKRTILLENIYLLNAAYITAASPLIAEQYFQHYKRPVTVINNVFSKKYSPIAIKESKKPLKLFWFSQTIGKGRGLEDIILAMKEMPPKSFQLTLIGKYDEAVKSNLFKIGKYGQSNVDIDFINPLPEAELFNIASMHDIGLALETGKDVNNGIALSNKIFTYLLAGNAIIFSDTPAQRQFYEENTEVGLLYRSGDVESLKKLLSRILVNPAMVDGMKKNALRAATEKYNWEMESKKLSAIIEAL